MSVAGLRPGTLFYLYRYRLRNQKMQEALAGGGIAIGVALVFGVLLANTSLTNSAEQLVKGVVGSARLQLVSRSSEGFSQRTADAVWKLPGVEVASPILRENATLVGPRGRESVELVGVTASLVTLHGSATRNLGAGAQLLSGGVGLPSGVAHATGAESEKQVTLLAGGEAHRVVVRAVLGGETIGSAASDGQLVVALLPVAQRLTGMSGRVTNVLVKPRPGDDNLVAQGLRRLAAGRADVTPALNELRLIKETAKPVSQSTGLFAAISMMVGLLLAVNAMLLTVPERRRFIAEMRSHGYDRRQILLVVGSQAIALGLIASLVGLALGGVLAHTVFFHVPVYLSVAFPIGAHEVIQPSAVLLALGSGVLAALLACVPLLSDLRSARPVDAILHEPGEPGQRIAGSIIRRVGALGASIVLAVTIIVALAPRLTVVGGVMLALAVVCLAPVVFAVILKILKRVSGGLRGSMLAVSVMELEATAVRSIALIGVAALAVYGSVAVQGARHDLLHGLDQAVVEYLDTADLWVTTNDNFLTVNSFPPESTPAAIARSFGIASVRDYQGGLLDIGSRRIWIRARSSGDRTMIQASQMRHGNLRRASRQLREGGWAVISGNLAEERHLKVGGRLILPTPSGPAHFTVAAITTNVGWAPGAITINKTDYRRYWDTANVTALEVNLKPGIAPAQGKRTVEQAIRGRPGLRVETFAERKRAFESSAREGMDSLSEISTLLLIMAALAIASALSTTIWQRRARLAAHKAQGFDRWQLWRALLLESAIVLFIGCADGTILGLYGHALASRWLGLSTGFPAPFSIGEPQIILALSLVSGIALMVVALPGLSAVRVPPRASLQE